MFKRVLWWVMCLSAVVMWTVLPISLQLVENYETREIGLVSLLIVGGSSVSFSVSLMLALFQGWKSLEADTTEDDETPFREMRSGNIDATQAVAYLFVPLFNIYWQFVAFAGWCKQARLHQSAAEKKITTPPMGVAIVAIVGGWLASMLIVVLPPIGFGFGIASTAAYLIVADAMLTWQDAPMPPARLRGLAYFGIVDDKVDIRLVLGTIVTTCVVSTVMFTTYFYINPLMYEFLADMDGNLLQALLRQSVVAAMTIPVMIALPAVAGWVLDLRSPWLLVPFVFLASVVTSGFTTILLGLWDGDGLPQLDGLVSIASYWFIHAAAAAAVIALLSVARSATAAVAGGAAVVFVFCAPPVSSLSHTTYMLTNHHSFMSWSSALIPFSANAHWAGLTLLQYSLVAIGVVLVHTLFRSPLVTPERPSTD